MHETGDIPGHYAVARRAFMKVIVGLSTLPALVVWLTIVTASRNHPLGHRRIRT